MSERGMMMKNIVQAKSGKRLILAYLQMLENLADSVTKSGAGSRCTPKGTLAIFDWLRNKPLLRNWPPGEILREPATAAMWSAPPEAHNAERVWPRMDTAGDLLKWSCFNYRTTR